jgi:hypothetical protein
MKPIPSPLFRHFLFVAVLGCLGWGNALAQEPAASPSPKPPEHAHAPAPYLPGGKWHVNDMKRPAPPVVTPGSFSSPEAAAKPPSDAIVLFDGTDTSQWESVKGGPAPWKIEDGAMVTSESDIQTKQKFGDLQIHVEYAEPTPPEGTSQGRGNSGIFLMGLFEIQVLDNYNNPTYPDGQAGAVYAQTPPMANACRPPGEWQVYDIAFTAPRLDSRNNVSTPGYATVFHNGVLVQNHTAIMGPTGPGRLTDYHSVHVSEGPLRLQFHHDPVRYRSVWVRPLVEPQ